MTTETLTRIAGILLSLGFSYISGLSNWYSRLGQSDGGTRQSWVVLVLVPSTIHCLSSYVWTSPLQRLRRYPASKPAKDWHSSLIIFLERMRERPGRGSGRTICRPSSGLRLCCASDAIRSPNRRTTGIRSSSNLRNECKNGLTLVDRAFAKSGATHFRPLPKPSQAKNHFSETAQSGL